MTWAGLGASVNGADGIAQAFEQFGAFGVAIVIAWWMLRRSDTQVELVRKEGTAEENYWRELYRSEVEAHATTRAQLLAALTKETPND